MKPSLLMSGWQGYHLLNILLMHVFNKANLRNLIAATGLVILNRIQIVDFAASVTVKFDGWPRKTIGHFFYMDRRADGQNHS